MQPRAANDIIISAFASVSGEGCKAVDVPLQYFCDTVTGKRHNKCVDRIERLRRVDKDEDKDTYNRIKNSLPGVTPSCRCTPGMSHASHEEYNEVWCVDIDGKDNPHIKPDEWGEWRDAFANLRYCYLSALSAGGKGIFLLLAVDPSQDRAQVWEALKRYFAVEYGITLDKACGNVGRFRFMSYDPDAVTKQPTTRFRAISAPIVPKAGKTTASRDEMRQNARKWANTGDEYDRARAAVKLFIESGAILDDYDEWKDAAAALKHLPDGEALFISMSRTSSKFKSEEECRLKFRQASSLNRIGIGKLFYICERHGISEAAITAEYRRMRGEAQPSDGKRDSAQCVAPQSAKQWRAALDAAARIIEAEPSEVERQVKAQDAQLWQSVYVGDKCSQAVSAEEMRRAFSPSEEAPASAPF